MATGIQPRAEPELTRSELEVLERALADPTFRRLLGEYVDEVRDPSNRALYQRELAQLERQRGVRLTFLNPAPGYVLKTSVAGARKALVNVCSDPHVGRPACARRPAPQPGLAWTLPYSLIPPREEWDRRRRRCVCYDVVFHPDALRLARADPRFRRMLDDTALDALVQAYGIELDRENVRRPRAAYKGEMIPAVIRKEDPDFKPEDVDETGLSPEAIEKLYPQKNFPLPKPETSQPRRPPARTENVKQNQPSYTVPKYSIRQQKAMDLQDFTYDRSNKRHAAIPTGIIVEVNLPLISSTSDCILDVQERNLNLVCEKPARYKLNVTLPYSVDEERGNAKFDISKRLLIITLPVSRKNFKAEDIDNGSLKVDSGVESEEYSASQSDEEAYPGRGLITELVSELVEEPSSLMTHDEKILNDEFLEPNIAYVLPPYTYNILDETIAFTFHVKNTDPDSIEVKSINYNVVRIKFTSIGSGFVPIHYTAHLKFDESIVIDNLLGEAWDNNVILQMNASTKPKEVFIGLDECNTTRELFDEQSDNNVEENGNKASNATEDTIKPVIEVTNMMSETTVTVSSNDSGSDSSSENQMLKKERKIVWIETSSSEGSAKGILRKPMCISRSLSESSAGDVASSMDYISSDCIPEESSLKKTVRFNDVIAKQVYRINSSIEGQKKKNQRKKSKKRNQDRRKSESEAEEEVFNNKMVQARPNQPEMLRRDSGLVDTSDAEVEDKKPTKGKSKPRSVTCDTIQHKTDLYDPDKLNKGQYLDVNFKNDLIFDLDM